MREQREALMAVLFPPEDDTEPTDVWKADLADAILREWLPGALADERVVEAAAQALRQYASTCEELAALAFSAAVTALTEDDV